MTVIILGGNSFLGLSLYKRLIGATKVYLAVRSKEFLLKFPENDVVATLDAADIVAMRNIIRTSDSTVIINCVTNYGRKQESEDVIREANVVYPMWVLAELKASNLNFSFINIGTSLASSVSFYAQTKNEFSDWLKKQTVVPTVNLQTELFYGFQWPAQNLVSQLIVKGLVKAEDYSMTSGLQVRDFIYVDDVVSAIEFIINKCNEGIKLEKCYSIGTGDLYSIKELYSKIKSFIPDYKTSLVWGALPDRPTQEINTTTAMPLQVLNWQSSFNLEQGLEKAIADYRNYFSR